MDKKSRREFKFFMIISSALVRSCLINQIVNLNLVRKDTQIRKHHFSENYFLLLSNKASVVPTVAPPPTTVQPPMV